MTSEIRFPKFGLTMTEGTFLRWLKEEGQQVDKGDILFEIESEKAVMEVEAPASGVLLQAQAVPGDVVPVGQVIGLIGEPGAVPKTTEPLAPGVPAALKGELPKSATATTPGAGAKRRIVASPVARRLAKEAGLDLSEIVGTGPGGRVTKEDVERALAARDAEPKPALTPVKDQPQLPASQVTPFAGVRRTIADRMAHSAHSTAPVTLTTEAEATEMVRLRESLKGLLGEAQPVPTYNDILIKLVAQALAEHPVLNSRLAEDGIHLLQEINVGLAVDMEQGLLVPVIHNADQLSLIGVAGETRQLIERVQAGQFLPDDLQGGTFTVTNLGSYEIGAFTPIINPPECAVLGVGQIAPKAVVRDGQVVARSMVTLSLTFDHRLVDGAPAARFLQRIKSLVENPLGLVV